MSDVISCACSRSDGEGSRMSLPRGVGREQDEMADALRMARGVGDCDQAAVRHPEQGGALEPDGVDDGFEIANPRVAPRSS
jgi:hypothetical protein